MRRPAPRSTLARATLPVIGGILFFGLLALATWGAAALLSGNPDRVNERLAVDTFEVGDIDSLSGIIAEDGPLIFPDLVQSGGTRTVVLDHTGDDPARNWRIFYAYPADGTLECKVTQVRGTRDFTDCTGRTLGVDDLAPPEGVFPVVQGERIIIDLRGVRAADSAPATTG